MKHTKLDKNKKKFFKDLYALCFEHEISIEEANMWWLDQKSDEEDQHYFTVSVGCVGLEVECLPIEKENGACSHCGNGSENPVFHFDVNKKRGKWQEGGFQPTLEIE